MVLRIWLTTWPDMKVPSGPKLLRENNLERRQKKAGMMLAAHRLFRKQWPFLLLPALVLSAHVAVQLTLARGSLKGMGGSGGISRRDASARRRPGLPTRTARVDRRASDVSLMPFADWRSASFGLWDDHSLMSSLIGVLPTQRRLNGLGG